jgi:hypothetical protein
MIALLTLLEVKAGLLVVGLNTACVTSCCLLRAAGRGRGGPAAAAAGTAKEQRQ